MMPSTQTYERATVLADKLELTLRCLGRWDAVPMPEEKFENMGAFGSATMSFEQWLQFVLIPTIHDIVNEKAEFPDDSMLTAYAVRIFDADPEAHPIQDILYEIDLMITGAGKDADNSQPQAGANDSVTVGSESIPAVLFTLAEVLHQFNGDDLESQLQTFDSFLDILSPKVRPTLSNMLREAAQKAVDPATQVRLEQAATSIADGTRVTAPYNHEEAMRKYREEHKKSYPDQTDNT